MNPLPTGTVTFVFTDIEGSTHILERLGDAGFGDVLEQHHRLVRSAFQAGVEIRSEGDAFFYVFASAKESIAAAIAAQRALAAHTWPTGGTVRVRIGLHTGEGRLGGDDYVGLDIHRAARISASGHGGQILSSASTRASADEGPDGDAAFRDLGIHHFKDISEPERIFQVTAPGLDSSHPPIKSLEATPNNLPAPPSALVGRTKELEEVIDLLGRVRLVTLTGPSGSGKSRLAIGVASQVLGLFRHGVTYVALEGLHSSDHVVPTIADALEIGDDGQTPRLEAVAERLSGGAHLLILDSFEHLLDAAKDVGALLETVPELRVLVTSQSLLRLRVEHVYRIPPLVPAEAVELFASRVAISDPSFTVTADNQAQIGALVSRLDALPLALELAAPHVRLFGLDGLLTRLSGRLDLSAGLTDAPKRHHTLRHAIGWSYELLSDQEQAVFRQLGGFEGGFALDAAERVVAPQLATAVVPGIATLLDKSLLQQSISNGEIRFLMLDSIQEYALQRLDEADELGPVVERHAAFYAGLAEQAGPQLGATGQGVWLDRLTAELDNLRAVARRGVATAAPDPGLRCFGAAWRFFHRRGHMLEATSTLEQLLSLPEASPEGRAIGFTGLAALLYWQGRYDEALGQYHRARALFRDLGDRFGEAEALFGLSTTSSLMGNAEEGQGFAELARAAYENAGAPDGVHKVVSAQSMAFWSSGNLTQALETWAEAEALLGAAGDRAEELQSRAAQAVIEHQLGRSDEALSTLIGLLDDMEAAGDVTGLTLVLDFTAAILAERNPRDAVVLDGAATRLREELGGGLKPETIGLPDAREIAGEVLPPAELDELLSRGEALDLDEAVQLARSVARSRA